MRFLKPKYYGKSRFEAEWNDALVAYRRHLEIISPALTDSVRAFLEYTTRHPLHDRVLERVDSSVPRELRAHLTGLRLEFVGVRSSKLPEMSDEQAVWLYEELDVAPRGGFVFHALTDGGELHVEAEGLWLFGEPERRYLIPDEPPSEAPTLFQDRYRGGRRSR